MDKTVRKPTVSILPEAFQGSEDTAVYWLSGAGFFIHSRNTNILIDPVLTRNAENPSLSEGGLPLKVDFPLDPSAVPGDCYVLYTHADSDHLGPETARTLAGRGCTMVGTLAIFERLARLGVAPEQIQVLRIHEEIQIGDVLVESIIADHPWQLKDLARGGRPYRIGECSGFILNTSEGRLFFPGDTRLMEDHFRIHDIDLLALDVSTDEYHLNHTSAAVLANHFPEALLLPCHYGTYDCPHISAHKGEPEEVYANVKNSDKRGLIPAPGEPVKVK